MNKKEIRRRINEMILDGSSHQEIFDELREDSSLSINTLADLIKITPTLKAKELHKAANTFLLIILIITVILKLLIGFSLVSDLGISWSPIILLIPILNVIMAYGVATYKGEFYKIIAIFSILGIFKSLRSLDGANPAAILTDLAISVTIITLGFYLNSVLVGKYRKVKEEYTNEYGQVSRRDTIKFNIP